jgi:elongation factor 3
MDCAYGCRPQCLFLDEPTNFLDREALGGLAVAIKEWGGAVCIISHSTEFVSALCPELWHVDLGELTHRGKVALVEDAFDDPSRPSSRSTSKAGTPRTGTPGLASGVTSASTSAANSGAEDAGDHLAKLALKPKKKKKVSVAVLFSLDISADEEQMTRNELKAQEERRRLRKLNWLTYGG